MKKNTWPWTVAAVVVIAVIIGLIVGHAGHDNTFKVGFVGPLTGDAASYGTSAQQGVELAVADINKNGGIDGKKVQVIYEDGKCTGQDAISATQKLINIDHVKFILGGGCSGETMAMGPVVQSAHVLALSSMSSDPQISQLGDYVFRNHPSDDEAGLALANLIYVTKNTPQAAVIAENTDYSQGIKQVFVNDYSQAGGQVPVNESFDTGTTDFRSILGKVKDSGVTAVFVDAQTEASGIQIVNQMKQLGITAQVYIAYLTGDNIKKDPAFAGAIAVDLPGLGSSTQANQFSADFKAMFNQDPNYPYFAAASYDALHLFRDGIAKVGDDPTAVSKYLYGIPSYTGAAGTYHFDSNGDVVGISLSIKQLVNGNWVLLQ